MKKELNKSFTENGAQTFLSSESRVLDLFSAGGAYRNRDADDVKKNVSLSLGEDKLNTIKCLFYLRDVRGGQGERRTFREGFNVISNYYPKDAAKLIKLIPEYGRWDDLFYIENIDIKNMLISQIQYDIKSDMPSLLGKWLPSENTSSQKTKELATKLRKYLGYSSKNYRKLVSHLRKKINVVEGLMSSNKWGDIEFNKIPSKASINYREAFSKHDRDRYLKYLEDVAEGKNKINTATLFPYEIVAKARKENSKTLDLLWENLPDYTNNNEKAIVVADVSGSMIGTPMDVSVSLAMYFAERNEGIFKNKFITFSGNPSLQEITGNTLQQKIINLESSDWEMNTNLQGVFDLLLNTAVENNVPENEMPKTIYIVSDMEFDNAESGETNFETIKKKYIELGYKMPSIVFWNVDNRKNGVPVTRNEKGAVLVSGCSPSIFTMATNGTTPMKFMQDTLGSKRYDAIEEALKNG